MDLQLSRRKQNTNECRYNTVQQNMILYMVRQWLRQNMHKRYSQNKPHISPSRAAASYCEDLGENWPRYNGTALYVTAFMCPLFWSVFIHLLKNTALRHL